MPVTSRIENVAVFCASADGVNPIYRQEAEELGRALAERLMLSDDLRSGLFTFSRDLIAKMLSHEGLELSRLITAESVRFPEVSKLFETQAVGPVEASLLAYLQRHIDAGGLRRDDPSRMSRTLLSLCQGAQQRRLWGHETLDDKQIDAEASWVADVFLRAYGAEARVL